MDARAASGLNAHVPDVKLRLLGTKWRLGTFLSEERLAWYVERLPQHEAALAGYYGHPPTEYQLLRALAGAIVDETHFERHLEQLVEDDLLDADDVDKVATAAAGMILAHYFDHRATTRGRHVS